MFKRLLVANRGEIALRVMRACREMGIESVAVYSDTDASALHVAAADRAIRIGPAPAYDSYLSVGAIIGAARAAKADAIHPGYGFLSENPALASACADAGLVFVGPPAGVIERMGSKIEARRLMQKAGIPIVPGGTPDDQSNDGLLRALDQVGLPALVKASAGGGGKGMRTIRNRQEAIDAVSAARREAEAAFADGTLYVERLIEHPRHVEVQILADAHGHVVHLFERDCSLQRRHQKVIEESPSPMMTSALRERMTRAAVDAAVAASYRNAGTIEFLVDASAGGEHPPFYFLEMNTRLQVEHPVTEQVTGLDLVRAQLLVAAGAPLPWQQHEIVQRGHAIEARVYAEDPSNGFVPQAGRILLYREPRAPGIRIDSGVAEGQSVPVHYDPLLAKIIASAETRGAAISRLVTALRSFPVLGVRTNLPFLIRVLEAPAFVAGAVDTTFLESAGAALAADPDRAADLPPAVRAALAAYGAEQPSGTQGWNDPWLRLQGWRA